MGLTDNVYYKEGGDNFLSDAWKECHLLLLSSIEIQVLFFFLNREKLATVLFKICFQWLFLECAQGKIVYLIYWPVFNMEYINISNHNKYAIKTSSMLILIG